MQTVFEQFGIKKLSPSQLNKWNDCRGQWYASARAKVFDDAGPAAWRGDAVEAGLAAALAGRPDEAEAKARTAWDLREQEYAAKHDGETHPDAAEYEAEIWLALPRAIEALKDYPRPTSAQGWVDARPPRCNVDIAGKFDFAFPALDNPSGPGVFCLDLKTTGQLPSEEQGPKTDHAIAAALYAYGRRESEARILYVSTAAKPKIPHRLFVLGPDQIEAYCDAAATLVLQIEATLTAALAWSEYQCVTPEEALAELCRPNLLARGGGTFPIWKQDYKARVLDAVQAWR